jgi:hypothetical protein
MLGVGVGDGIQTDVRVWPTDRAVVHAWLFGLLPLKQLQSLMKVEQRIEAQLAGYSRRAA